MTCPHGMTSPLWCDECIVQEKETFAGKVNELQEKFEDLNEVLNAVTNPFDDKIDGYDIKSVTVLRNLIINNQFEEKDGEYAYYKAIHNIRVEAYQCGYRDCLKKLIYPQERFVVIGKNKLHVFCALSAYSNMEALNTTTIPWKVIVPRRDL